MKYREKPIVIDAIQFIYSKKGIDNLKDFVGLSMLNYGKERHMGAIGWVHIGTLEDGLKGEAKHVASEGDWIIKGVEGEFYPCKPAIFNKTYEKVEQ